MSENNGFKCRCCVINLFYSMFDAFRWISISFWRTYFIWLNMASLDAGIEERVYKLWVGKSKWWTAFSIQRINFVHVSLFGFRSKWNHSRGLLFVSECSYVYWFHVTRSADSMHVQELNCFDFKFRYFNVNFSDLDYLKRASSMMENLMTEDRL